LLSDIARSEFRDAECPTHCQPCLGVPRDAHLEQAQHLAACRAPYVIADGQSIIATCTRTHARTCVHVRRARETLPAARRRRDRATAASGLLGPSPSLFADPRMIAGFSSTFQDTRTHVVVELYDTERSYVEALQILVNVSTRRDSLQERDIGPSLFLVVSSSRVLIFSAPSSETSSAYAAIETATRLRIPRRRRDLGTSP